MVGVGSGSKQNIKRGTCTYAMYICYVQNLKTCKYVKTRLQGGRKGACIYVTFNFKDIQLRFSKLKHVNK